MSFSLELIERLETVEPELRAVLWAILKEIEHQRETTVTRTDFAELRASLSELAVAQRQTTEQIQELRAAQRDTEKQVKTLNRSGERLDRRMEELAESSRTSSERLDRRMEALAKSHETSNQRMDRLTEELAEIRREGERSRNELREAMASLARTTESTKSTIGGLSRSQAYALENDAYRHLPAFLAKRGIEVTERFIRTELDGKEINLLAHARRQGEEIVIVGESVTRLDDRSKFAQLEEHLHLARAHYACPVLPVLITHYARPQLLELAERENILVVQSFEWN